MANTKIVQASGARKEAVARATIKPGKGIIKVNGQLLENFSNRMSRLRISEPLVLAEDIVKKTDVSVKVNGGGVNGQADAIRLSIARAL
ncbi:30S ribosomal protein S9, partial [Candidatus Woesearchaeota archaeon]|nr:30S ribosomal protein S9 [Candidatus Woesearchaeota archaeon]